MINGWTGALLKWLGFGGRTREDATGLYAALVAQARLPDFYRDLGVADTVEGRFDMLCLHGFLVLHRLKSEGASADDLGQALVDGLFLDLDRSLREMGVGDLSVARRMKTLGQAFYGRAAAYEDALEAEGNGDLAAAIARNLFRDAVPVGGAEHRMAAYVRASFETLARCDMVALRTGRLEFAGIATGEGEA